VIAGSVTFGVIYLSSVLTAASVLASDLNNGKMFSPLFAPIVGPFIAIGTTNSSGGTPLLVLDGLAQLAGMTMLICGAAIEEKYLQRAAEGHTTPLDVFLHPPQVILGARGGALRWAL
jgi:hypothetical protein